MNLNSINGYMPRFSNYRMQSNSFYNGGNSYISIPTLDFDTATFSPKPKMKRRETVNDILKNAKIGNEPRFSEKEQYMLARDLKNFKSKIPTEKILKKLLNMEDFNGEKLGVFEIASFFQVMDEATIPQIKGTLALLERALIEEDGKEELDRYFFIPLENNPDLIKHIGNSENRYKNLPVEDRANLMYWSLAVADIGQYKHNKMFPKIADSILASKSGIVCRLLLEGARSATPEEFSNLLSSFTPENVKQLDEKADSMSNDDVARYLSCFINYR